MHNENFILLRSRHHFESSFCQDQISCWKFFYHDQRKHHFSGT